MKKKNKDEEKRRKKWREAYLLSSVNIGALWNLPYGNIFISLPPTPFSCITLSLSLSLSLHLWLCACACTYARIFYVSRNVSCSHYIVYILNRIVNRVVLCRPNLSAPNNNKQEPHTHTQLGHNEPNRRLTTNNPMPPIPNKTHNNLCKDD